MIDTRLFGYVALAFVSILLYQAWVQDYGTQSPQTAAPPVDEEVARDLPQADFSAIPDKPEIETAGDFPAPAVAQTGSALYSQVTVETDVLRLKIDIKGGTIVSAELLEYSIDLQHPDESIHIFSTEDGYFVAQSGLQAKDLPAPDHYAEYQVAEREYTMAEGADELSVPMLWQDASGISVTKTFVLKRGQYDIDVVHKIENTSQNLWQGREYRQLQRNFNDEGSKLFIHTYTGGAIFSAENHYEKIDFKKMAESPLKRKIVNGWAAMLQHYFVSAWIPQRDEENQYYSRGVDGQSGLRYVLGLSSPVKSVAAGQTDEFVSKLYVGPKIQDTLEKLAEGLELTVDYGYLTVISKPLFWLLQQVHKYIGNWGWAIIIVTLLIKAVFYKLAETSYRSMANMRRVQPKMMAIRERYGDDKQRQSQAMMELYKKEKINPLGGCLPMIIQIPVFIALYWVLLESVELRQAPFILWINDLSVKDPYFVLPVIMGISMYIQQKLNPAPIDPIQAKVFMLLPFIFTVFFAFFPAGLVLYWVVNNLLTIAQQWFITRRVLGEK